MHMPEWHEIRIQGQLSEGRADWFEGLTLRVETPGETILSGKLDQSALHGVLAKIRNLGLPLLDVARIDPPESPGTPTDQ